MSQKKTKESSLKKKTEQSPQKKKTELSQKLDDFAEWYIDNYKREYLTFPMTHEVKQFFVDK